MAKKCFLISSFEDDELLKQRLEILNRVAGTEYECEHGGVRGNVNVPDQVIQKIAAADLVVADLTVPSPNVYYELGIAFSLEKTTICFVLGEDVKLPFNYQSYQVIRARNEDALQLELLQILNNPQMLNDYKTNQVIENAQSYFAHREKFKQNINGIVKARQQAEEFTRFMQLGQTDNSVVARAMVAKLRREPYQLDNEINDGGYYAIAISGAGSLGKSSFSKLLKASLDAAVPAWRVQVLPTDAYMADRAERAEKGMTGFHVRAHDLDRFAADLHAIRSGQRVEIFPYDHATGEHDHDHPIAIERPHILLLEGIHSFYFSNESHVKVFMQAPKTTILEHKFLADCRNRGYTAFEAFEHAQQEYAEYERHVLPYLPLADETVYVDGYWRYRLDDVAGQASKEEDHIRQLRRGLVSAIRDRDEG